MFCTLFFHLQARHIYICDHHKNVIQSVRAKRKRKDSEEDSGETDSEHPEVDLFQLQVNTLRRYKKHFKVPSRPGLNKAQLADVSFEKGCTSHKFYNIFFFAEPYETFQNHTSCRKGSAHIFHLHD